MTKRTEMGYGFFCGGDPRKFWPDRESCSETELENHAKACAKWNAVLAKGEVPTPEKCPSGFAFNDAGECVGHILRAPYGIGTYEYEVEEAREDKTK